MRRKKQKLTEKQCIDILKRAKTATLALHGDDGYPYSVPVNYVYLDGKIYFHGAKSGHKIDAIKNNSKVSISIIDQEDVIEEELTTYFRSIILFGKAKILQDDDEIYQAVNALGLKYCDDEIAVIDYSTISIHFIKYHGDNIKDFHGDESMSFFLFNDWSIVEGYIKSIE